jgi:hypothetical protein
MRHLLTAAVAASLLMAGTASAAEIMRGRIESVDAERNMVKLRNGVAFSYGEDVNEAELTPGASVRIAYKSVKGQLVATSVTVTSKSDK